MTNHSRLQNSTLARSSDAISTNLHSALTSIICSDVLQATSSSLGEATTIARHRARETATFTKSSMFLELVMCLHSYSDSSSAAIFFKPANCEWDRAQVDDSTRWPVQLPEVNACPGEAPKKTDHGRLRLRAAGRDNLRAKESSWPAKVPFSPLSSRSSFA